MKLDFLRHIVNPLVEKYVEKGTLTSKDAIELKKLIHNAEGKYRFSIYNGDPLNLVNYLKSSDFRSLVDFLRSCNANEVLSEIIEKIRETYKEHPEVIEALNDATRYLQEEASLRKEDRVAEEAFDIENLIELVKEKLNPSEVSIDKNTVKALINEMVEFKISMLKQRIKIEVRFDKSIDKKTLYSLFSRVADIAEKATRVRL